MSLAQEFIKKELSHRVEKFAQLSSPLLVVGGVGAPLLELAEFLAQTRVCSSNLPTDRPCGECSDCVAFVAGQSTRVKKIVPDGQFIKVEQAKEAMEFLSFKKDREVVVVLHRADQLNVQAANALLKTIEEPPEKCWIILTAASSKSVLPTIRSRVQVLNLPPISKEFARAHLNSGMEAQNPARAVELLQGRLDRLVEQDGFFADLTEVEKWLADVVRTRQQPELPEWMDSKEGFLDGLGKIRLLLKDKLLSGQFKDPVSWIDLAEKIDDLESACLQNVDRKLLLDHLYMALEDL